MRLPEAKKARGRFSLILALAGDEDAPACFLPDVLPFTETDRMTAEGIDGERVYFNPDEGGSVIISLKQLESSKRLSDYISLCIAEGRHSLLTDKFDALIVLNNIYNVVKGKKEYLAIKYTGCAISQLKDGRLKLGLKPFGRRGALCGSDYTSIDDCFEAGWTYD